MNDRAEEEVAQLLNSSGSSSGSRANSPTRWGGSTYASLLVNQEPSQLIDSSFPRVIVVLEEWLPRNVVVILMQPSFLFGCSGSNHSTTLPSISSRSSTPLRYDPNDLSMEDDAGGSSNVGSAIKNLNFSRIACATDSADRAKRRGSREHREQEEDQTLVERSTSSESGATGLESAGTGEVLGATTGSCTGYQ